MTNIPPKKLSADTDHEFYDPLSMYVKVWLDGVRQRDCVTYNQTEGWIERLKCVDGKIVIENGDYVSERVDGVVDVEFTKDMK